MMFFHIFQLDPRVSLCNLISLKSNLITLRKLLGIALKMYGKEQN